MKTIPSTTCQRLFVYLELKSQINKELLYGWAAALLLLLSMGSCNGLGSEVPGEIVTGDSNESKRERISSSASRGAVALGNSIIAPSASNSSTRLLSGPLKKFKPSSRVPSYSSSSSRLISSSSSSSSSSSPPLDSSSSNNPLSNWPAGLNDIIASYLEEREAAGLAQAILDEARERATVSQYELGCRSYYDLGSYIPVGAEKRDACMQAAKLADSMVGKPGSTPSVWRYELACKSYLNLAIAYPRDKEKAYKRADDLSDGMLKKTCYGSTVKQYELASWSAYNLGNSLPAGEKKVEAYRKAADLADIMLREAEGTATEKQYEQACCIYYNLGASVKDPAAKRDALKMGNYLAGRMLIHAGDGGITKQYELIFYSYCKLVQTLPGKEAKLEALEQVIKLVDILYRQAGDRPRNYEQATISYSCLGSPAAILGNSGPSREHKQAARSCPNLWQTLSEKAAREAVGCPAPTSRDEGKIRKPRYSATLTRIHKSVDDSLYKSIPMALAKQYVYKRASELANQMLREAGTEATLEQYGWAHVIDSKLSEALPAGSERDAARARIAKIEEAIR
jgi:hypothetical protein